MNIFRDIVAPIVDSTLRSVRGEEVKYTALEIGQSTITVLLDMEYSGDHSSPIAGVASAQLSVFPRAPRDGDEIQHANQSTGVTTLYRVCRVRIGELGDVELDLRKIRDVI